MATKKEDLCYELKRKMDAAEKQSLARQKKMITHDQSYQKEDARKSKTAYK